MGTMCFGKVEEYFPLGGLELDKTLFPRDGRRFRAGTHHLKIKELQLEVFGDGTVVDVWIVA